MSGETPIQSSSRVRFELLKAGDGRYVLGLHGELDADSTPWLWKELKRKFEATSISALEIDAAGLTCCDSAGLAMLYFLSSGQMTPNAQTTLRGLKPELQKNFGSFSLADYQAFQSEQPVNPSVPEEVGMGIAAEASDLGKTMEFIGEVTVAFIALPLNPRQIRWQEVLRVFEKAGVNALPIVSLISLLVGFIIAFEATRPMARFGAQLYIANIIGVAMVRELGPIMTAILLAGRSGSAFAAELGTMKINEELDALETMGLDPVQFLVVQRLFASFLLTPLLTIYAMFTGVVGGGIVMLELGFPLPVVVNQFESSVEIQDLAFGTAKGFIFGLVVAGIGCLRGLQTKEGPSAVGASTTRSVVSGILLIVVLDFMLAALMFALKK